MVTALVHMWNLSAAGWILFGVFAAALIAGIALGVNALTRTGGHRAREILAERLARGEISPEEHRDRLSAIGHGRGRSLGTFAVVLGAAGLIGMIAVAATGPGGGFMRSMMNGGMGSMMGGGDTGRSGSPPTAGARDITISAKEFSFDPATITLRAGETVNITFKNNGMMFHSLTVGGLGLDLRANSGDSISGALRPDKPGTYSFICAVAGHAEAGMRGTIEVQ